MLRQIIEMIQHLTLMSHQLDTRSLTKQFKRELIFSLQVQDNIIQTQIYKEGNNCFNSTNYNYWFLTMCKQTTWANLSVSIIFSCSQTKNVGILKITTKKVLVTSMSYLGSLISKTWPILVYLKYKLYFHQTLSQKYTWIYDSKIHIVWENYNNDLENLISFYETAKSFHFWMKQL